MDERRTLKDRLADSVWRFFHEYSTDGSIMHYLGLFGSWLWSGMRAIEFYMTSNRDGGE